MDNKQSDENNISSDKREVNNLDTYAYKVFEVLPKAWLKRENDKIQIAYGNFRNSEGVVIVLMPNVIELRLPSLRWVGPYTPEETSILWQRVEFQNFEDLDLPKLIASAQAAQKQTFRRCKYCFKENPWGWMHSEDVCQSCAERYLGIVH